jgi:hypothetical protein
MECTKFALEKLEGEETPEFRAHLLGCPGCTRDVEELGDVRRLYREAAEEERWKGGVPAVHRRPASAWLTLAAAAAVVAAVLAGLLRGPEKTGTSSAAAPSPFFRVAMAPWDGEERRLARSLDEAWQTLERLEGSSR